MNAEHAIALSLTFLIYLVLAAAYFGWGRAAAFLAGFGKDLRFPVTALIWIGWAFSLLVFQTVHLFFPVTVFCVAPILGLGLVLALPSLFAAQRGPADREPKNGRQLLWIVIPLSVAGAGWLASKAMLPPTVYDSGLYHFNTIRWINMFPIVPGLGNLHGRLAFNQSYFVYAAAVNFHPFFGHGRSVANSFLFLLTVSSFLELLWPALKRPALLIRSHPFVYVSVVALFPYLGYLAVASRELSSPSPDLASTLMQLVMMAVLSQGLGKWRDGDANQSDRALWLCMLAATGVTLKLSQLAFAAGAMLFVLLYIRATRLYRIGIRMTALCMVLFTVWLLRGVILSGAPLYPSTLGWLPVEWAVPVEHVAEDARWVFSWARTPWEHWSQVLGNWEWLMPWLGRIRKNCSVVFPVATALSCGMATAAISCWKTAGRPRWLEHALVFPSVAGLTYWFFTAPDPRFAHGLFVALSTGAALIFLSSVKRLVSARKFVIVTCLCLTLVNAYWIGDVISKKWLVRIISLRGWYPVREVDLVAKVTDSGLAVYVPLEGDQCWDSPLPSTPYFNPRLRLRKEGDLSFGFVAGEPAE